MQELPAVYEYNNYRAYLFAILEARKKRNQRFSIGAWALRLNLKSSSTLIMILKGDRNPSSKLIDLIIEDLGLKVHEADYFRDLIAYEKAEDNEHVRALLKAKLAKQRPNKDFKPIDIKTYKSISEWYFPAIRELTDLADFQEDVDWIQARLRAHVTKPQIQEALRILQEIGHVSRDLSGKLRYNSNTTTTFDIPDEGIKRSHEAFLDLSKHSLRNVDPKEREISGVTFTCKQEDLPKIKARIRELIHDVVSTSEREHNSVYHLEIACIPVTKSKKT